MFGAVLDHIATARRLAQLGWMHPTGQAPSVEDCADAITRYQSHHGLPVCGKLDPRTERHLCACRTCRFPDVMAVSTDLQKWPDGMVITWAIETVAGVLNRTSAEAAYIAATQAWMSVCGVRFEPTANHKTAKLTVRFEPIDGMGRVLAWSELPDGMGAPRLQKFDSEEAWCISDKPTPAELDFVRVATHELGHILGVGHIAAGNILQPLYDPNIRTPKAGDVAEVVARYGAAPATPGTSGGSTPAAPKTVLEIAGGVDAITIPGYKIVKA